MLDIVAEAHSTAFHDGATAAQIADVKQHGFGEAEFVKVLQDAGFAECRFTEGPLSVKPNGSFRMGIWTGVVRE